MATYCMSDIHGNYKKYIQMLEKLQFSDNDTLYIIGDVIDRGNQSIKILQDMMLRPNVIPIIGNHEYMAAMCFPVLLTELTPENIGKLDAEKVRGVMEWLNVGGQSTTDEFHKLSAEGKQDIMEYLDEFSLYEEVSCGGKDFILVHAGLDNFREDRPLDDYSPAETLFHAPNYSRVYFSDKFLVTGHLPTYAIDGNPDKDYSIYRANNHIAIDCGCGFDGGRLGAICLDTGEGFYV